jgi:hypothetical protein
MRAFAARQQSPILSALDDAAVPASGKKNRNASGRMRPYSARSCLSFSPNNARIANGKMTKSWNNCVVAVTRSGANPLLVRRRAYLTRTSFRLSAARLNQRIDH